MIYRVQKSTFADVKTLMDQSTVCHYCSALVFFASTVVVVVVRRAGVKNG